MPKFTLNFAVHNVDRGIIDSDGFVFIDFELLSQFRHDLWFLSLADEEIIFQHVINSDAFFQRVRKLLPEFFDKSRFIH